MSREQDIWLEKHAFYCERLRCRMTPEYCRFLQSLYAESEKIPFKEWMGACSGRKQVLANTRRPSVCDSCPRRSQVNEGK